MAATVNRQIHLASRPKGMPTHETFTTVEGPVPSPGDGEVLVRTLYLSVDPYMRGRMNEGRSYVAPFKLNQALTGGVVGEVTASRSPAFNPGDLVTGHLGWQDYSLAPAGQLQPVDASLAPIETALGVLGMPGLTAYAGLLRVGEPKPGDTVMVSGAAGAVGSVVVQIAKIKGCRVIASAGTDDKVDWVRSLGADHVVNYKTCGNLLEALRAGAPDGIDVYFDNVGGDHLEAALELAKLKARIVLCGGISVYNATEPPPGPRNYMNIVGKSLRMEGFIVSNFQDMRAAFLKDMGEWIGAGKMKWEETVENGVENAPKAFLNLFTGANTGKMLVKLG
jgi:NADPH-dependent curcumin reductase CurA